MFQLQITVSSVEEAERILACLRHAADPAIVSGVAQQLQYHDVSGLSDAESPAKKHFPETTNTAAEKPKNPRGRPKRKVAPPLPESAAPEVKEADPVTVQEASQPASAQQTYTLDDVRSALKGVQAKYGTADMEKPLEILGKFGAGRVSEVQAKDYAQFIEACKAA